MGLFAVDTAHNLIHIVSGLAALAVFRSDAYSKLYAQIMGAVYAVVTVVGFVWPGMEVLGFIRMNMEDHFLAFVPDRVSFVYRLLAQWGRQPAHYRHRSGLDTA